MGAHGVIVASADDGATWSQVRSPVSSMLTCISFADAQHGWITGHEGVVLVSTDAGTTWTRAAVAAAADDSFLDILALPDGPVLAVGAYGLFLRSADGVAWERLHPFEEDMHLNRITAGKSGTLYLAGESGLLAVSADQGATWTQLEAPYEGSFYGLHELASGVLLAHGLRGHAYTSPDRGETWIQATIEHNGLLSTATELPGGRIALSGAGGQVFFSRDGGRTFGEPAASGLTASAEILAVDDVLVCVGDSGVKTIAVPKP